MLDLSPSQALGVSESLKLLSEVMHQAFPMLLIKGEISNCKISSSHHCFFSLRDETSQIQCVMFRNKLMALEEKMQDGKTCTLKATPSFYAPRGDFRLIVSELEFSQSLGSHYQAYLLLKAKLEKQGFFSAAHKKPLPFFPRSIALITSAQGAVLQDMLSVTKKRQGGADFSLFHAQVQGPESAQSLLQAISRVKSQAEHFDLLIVARGGGAFEDFSGFNSEAVVRSLYQFPIPVVSAVGHEVDYCLTDFVADLRAPTPSAAIEMVCIDRQEYLAYLQNLQQRLKFSLQKKCDDARLQLELLQARHAQFSIRLKQLSLQLEQATKKLKQLLHKAFEDAQQQLANSKKRLQALDPQRILERGFVMVTQEQQPISRAKDLNLQARVSLQFADSSLEAEISKPSRTQV